MEPRRRSLLTSVSVEGTETPRKAADSRSSHPLRCGGALTPLSFIATSLYMRACSCVRRHDGRTVPARDGRCVKSPACRWWSATYGSSLLGLKQATCPPPVSRRRKAQPAGVTRRWSRFVRVARSPRVCRACVTVSSRSGRTKVDVVFMCVRSTAVAGRFVRASSPSGGVVRAGPIAASRSRVGQLPREVVVADEQLAVMHVPATGRCA
jgi:hypothetical protein